MAAPNLKYTYTIDSTRAFRQTTDRPDRKFSRNPKRFFFYYHPANFAIHPPTHQV